MKRETIVYRKRRYHRYPESDRRQLRVYYWRHGKGDTCPVALHRQIWIDLKGDIPKGYIVHHKDEDPLNNKIDNLELLSHSAHAGHHSRQLYRRKMSQENIKLAQEAAKSWHRSKEGRAWHVQNAKSYWEKRKK